MKKTNTIFVIGTVGCIVMAIAYAAIGILGLISGTFPLGYSVEAFTTNKMGAVILFLAAAANVVSVIVTQIVYHTFDRIGLISKGTMCVGMAFVALIFVFQQSIIPIAFRVLGGAFSVATLAACSEIVNPKKVEKTDLYLQKSLECSIIPGFFNLSAKNVPQLLGCRRGCYRNV